MNRRTLVSSLAAPTVLASQAAARPVAGNPAKIYVLVHGAYGGWIWRDVADGLRHLGHRVWTPTQIGVGERSPLMLLAGIG